MILRDAQREPVNVFKLLDLCEINQSNSSISPKIINTYPLGTFGIDVSEVTDGLDRAANKNTEDNSWNIKALLKKIVS